MRLIAALLASTFAASAATGWAQLLPAGEFAGRDGRPGPGKAWRVSDQRGQALAAALSAITARTPIVIDYDHQTLFAATSGIKAPAAGWIKAAEWRTGEGLFAQVEWTAAAKGHIDAGEYRYISPVILFDEATGDVNAVALASLVNHPDLLGMDAVTTAALAAITSHEPHPPSETHHMDLLAALITALALPTNTTQEAALSAVSALRTTAEAAGARPLVPAALSAALGLQASATEAAALSAVASLKAPDTGTTQLVAALQAEVNTLKAGAAERGLGELLDKAVADMKIAPASREHYAAIGRKDLAALSALIGALPAIPGLAGQTGGTDPTGKGGAAALSADTEKMRAGFGLTAEQWAKGAPAAS